jgi:hypothetical protein
MTIFRSSSHSIIVCRTLTGREELARRIRAALGDAAALGSDDADRIFNS